MSARPFTYRHAVAPVLKGAGCVAVWASAFGVFFDAGWWWVFGAGFVAIVTGAAITPLPAPTDDLVGESRWERTHQHPDFPELTERTDR